MPQFRAKARAIELLGKGQIADLPTAITELWKNGYDAYAKNLECKLYLKSYRNNASPLFVLADDGFGMTNDDLLNKWLILGTDSKTRGTKIKAHFGLEERPPMGEKGIGRLSVSYLGNTLLLLTKKQNEPVQCLFIDWRVLENYNFFLDDLELPIFTFNSIKNFDAEFNVAIEIFRLNFLENKWKEQGQVRKVVLSELKELIVPLFIEEDIIKPYLENEYHGTSFLVFKPHEQLLELDATNNLNYEDDITIRYIRSSLTGLHNDLNGSKKDFSTTFSIYNSAGKYDVIENFFTANEMQMGDHWLKGSFDENGFFSGELRVFNQVFRHTFKPIRPLDKTSYGPFNIQWGQFEGTQRNSLLNEEEFRLIENKLEQFGGLYIYRDNFRVLPYGRQDADFLGFEERRSKRAGEYFFSHRRFIGYIDISRNENSSLSDKAGREGFIQNKAYREFRDDLTSFFVDIAVRYLKTVSNNPEENTSSRAVQLKEISDRYNS